MPPWLSRVSFSQMYRSAGSKMAMPTGERVRNASRIAPFTAQEEMLAMSVADTSQSRRRPAPGSSETHIPEASRLPSR